MNYNVGDKVRIKSLDWYNENTNKCGYIMCGCVPFNTDMSVYCGKVLTICNAKEEFSYYQMKECKYVFTDEMIEGLVEEENTLKTQSDNMETETHKGYYTTEPETTSEGKKRCVVYFWDNDFADKVELDLSGRELIQENDKWFVVKKKKEYPKTFRECQDCLEEDVPPMNEPISKTNRRRLVHLLEILLVCRDAYWKLYGEEMGLGKPWEPRWNDGHQKKYCIYNGRDDIQEDVWLFANFILAFPTEEMRDAFYENFKVEIESCKELL